MQQPVILFLYNDPRRVNYRWASHHWLASEVGFRPYAANWKNVRVSSSGTAIRGGYEAISPQKKRYFKGWERIEPQVIIHRKQVGNRLESLITNLAETHPKALVSYHPLWKHISRKKTAELCFRTGELTNTFVSRPKTYIIEKHNIYARLKDVAASKPLIFKPSAGSMCRGIRMSTPDNFQTVAERLSRSRSRQFVAQELIEDPVLYGGKKFDLRIYILVTCFNPLRFKVYHEGVVRIAAREFNQTLLTDGLRALTGCSYRKRRGVRIENIPISELLEYLRGKGYKVGDFWDQVDVLVKKAFMCLTNYPGLFHVSDLSRRFYLGGIDVLMVNRGDSFELLFLETNYVPQLNAWGAVVNRHLQSVHRQWSKDLLNLCHQNL